MSGRRILLFIFSVYAILALICLLFPADGVAIAGTSLNFPTISEVRESLSPARDEPGPSPEELLQQRMQAIRQAEQQKFETYFKENPARLYFPGDDESLFDPFFASLDSARNKQMRILHYGDSQIEEDRITGTLRAGLQERFGGSGPGIMPFGNPYYTLNYSQSSTATLHKTMIFSDGRAATTPATASWDSAPAWTPASSQPSARRKRTPALAGPSAA